MTYKGRRLLSIGLGLLSSVGTVITAILVAKETPKAMAKIIELKRKKDVKKFDYIKELAPIYWPAIVSCLGTIASTTISQVMSFRSEAALIATTTMLSQGWRKYKDKVKDVIGIDAEKKISDSLSIDEYSKKALELKVPDSEYLFYEEHLGFFRCKKEDLFAGLSDLNQRLHTADPGPNGTYFWTTLAILMKDSNATVYDKDKLKICKNVGWTTDYLCEVYDLKCMWVHPIFTRIANKETGEILYTKLDFFEDPIYLYESETSWDEYRSRATFEHDIEMDMCDYNAYQLYSHSYEDLTADDALHDMYALVNDKPKIDLDGDDGRRFMSANPKGLNKIEYSDAEGLPDINDIPSMEDVK